MLERIKNCLCHPRFIGKYNKDKFGKIIFIVLLFYIVYLVVFGLRTFTENPLCEDADRIIVKEIIAEQDANISYDAETKPYELFCKNIIVEFKRLILKELGLGYEKEVVFEGEPENFDEFELLSNLLRDFAHMIIVKKKVKLVGMKKDNIIDIALTFSKVAIDRKPEYFSSFLLMINSAISKNKELKEKFKIINNLANDIMEKSNETR